MNLDSAHTLNAVASKLRRTAADAERLGLEALARELREMAADILCALEVIGWLL